MELTTTEQIEGAEIPTYKIYKDRAIWLGTFLGGPLVAGYLIAENFKAFQEKDKVNKTWIYTVLATIVIFGGVFMIPEDIHIPNQLIPLLYTGIAYYLVYHFQGANISLHTSSGGQFFGWGRTLLIGFIGLAITLVVVLGSALVTDSIANASLTTKKYGTINHEIEFDKDNISESEVNAIANALTEAVFFDEAQTKYIYLEKVNNSYEIYIPIVDGITNDSEAMQPFIDLRDDVQTLFSRNKIVLKLSVDVLENVVKTIE